MNDNLIERPFEGLPARQEKLLLMFLLDNSGSMTSYQAETERGFDDFIRSLCLEAIPISFSLLKWDKLVGGDKVRVDIPYLGVALSNVAPLHSHYHPLGNTPLIDAVMGGISMMEGLVEKEKNPSRIQIVIQTDGEENASTLFSMMELHDKVEEKRKLGWLFTLIYCGFGGLSGKTAEEIGIPAQDVLRYDQSRSTEAIGSVLSSYTSRYSKSGISSGYSKEERGMVLVDDDDEDA